MRVMKPDIGPKEFELVQEVLRSGFLTSGKKTEYFEQLIAEYIGVQHAIAVSSGTAALHLSVLALDIKEGDEVIVPDFTFPSTANAVKFTGATPILTDVELDTYNIDPTLIESKITEKTKAIMPVDLFGLPAHLGAIKNIADRYQLPIIEDAACSLGAKYNSIPCGNGQLSQLACLSFHPRKVITTGEGGMILTDSEELGKKLKLLRNHYMENINGTTHFTGLGYNYRLSDILSAIGIAQIDRLDNIISQRRDIAGLYHQYLNNIDGIILPTEPDYAFHIYQSYVIRLQNSISRKTFMDYLARKGIETTIGTYAVHQQDYYKNNPPCPHSKILFDSTVSLPLHHEISEADIKVIAEEIQHALLVAV